MFLHADCDVSLPRIDHARNLRARLCARKSCNQHEEIWPAPSEAWREFMPSSIITACHDVNNPWLGPDPAAARRPGPERGVVRGRGTKAAGPACGQCHMRRRALSWRGRRMATRRLPSFPSQTWMSVHGHRPVRLSPPPTQSARAGIRSKGYGQGEPKRTTCESISTRIRLRGD